MLNFIFSGICNISFFPLFACKLVHVQYNNNHSQNKVISKRTLSLSYCSWHSHLFDCRVNSQPRNVNIVYVYDIQNKLIGEWMLCFWSSEKLNIIGKSRIFELGDRVVRDFLLISDLQYIKSGSQSLPWSKCSFLSFSFHRNFSRCYWCLVWMGKFVCSHSRKQSNERCV